MFSEEVVLFRDGKYLTLGEVFKSLGYFYLFKPFDATTIMIITAFS